MDAQEINTLLSAAQTAYHELMIGDKPREIRDQNGETVVYTVANREALRSYIMQLQASLTALADGGGPVQPRALFPLF